MVGIKVKNGIIKHLHVDSLTVSLLCLSRQFYRRKGRDREWRRLPADGIKKIIRSRSLSLHCKKVKSILNLHPFRWFCIRKNCSELCSPLTSAPPCCCYCCLSLPSPLSLLSCLLDPCMHRSIGGSPALPLCSPSLTVSALNCVCVTRCIKNAKKEGWAPPVPRCQPLASAPS